MSWHTAYCSYRRFAQLIEGVKSGDCEFKACGCISDDGATKDGLLCREHPEAVLIEDETAGDVICSACGLIVGDRVIDPNEWTAPSLEDIQSNATAKNPPLDHAELSKDIPLGSAVDYEPRKITTRKGRIHENPPLDHAELSQDIPLGSAVDYEPRKITTRKGRIHENPPLDHAELSQDIPLGSAVDYEPRKITTRKGRIHENPPLDHAELSQDIPLGSAVDYEPRKITTRKGRIHENPPLDHAELSQDIPLGSAVDYEPRKITTRKGRIHEVTIETLKRGNDEILDIGGKLHLSQALMDKAMVMLQTVREKLPYAKKIEAYAAGCTYLACKQDNAPRTFIEIAEVSRASKKEIISRFKNILKLIGDHSPPVTAEDLMSRLCAKLNLPWSVEKAAVHIAKKAKEMDLVCSQTAVSLAAAAVYMASQASSFTKSRKDVAEMARVSESTIRMTYKSMRPKALQLFPADFRFRTPVNKLPDN